MNEEVVKEEARNLASRVEELAKGGNLIDGTVEEINSLKKRMREKILKKKEDILAEYLRE